MTPTDLELYITGNYDGDVEAFEAKIAADPELQRALATEARLEQLLGDAAAAAAFCPSCGDIVRDARCELCGVAVRPGGYTVERVLVGNAHGRMYVARDVDGKQVALKELAFVQSPTLAAIAAFEREVKILRALEHPAIPRFCASFEEGRGVHTRYYLAQELVDGQSLDTRLVDHWYSEAEIIEIATQVLEVLVYLQSLSPMVIHRDIKPANLLRRADGTLAVVDFGAAHVQGATAGSTSIGTFGYMPVEQLAGIVDATTDLYALGASLVHLLTRQEPWRVVPLGDSTSLNVSAPIRRFLDKLVAPLTKDRFASAEAALAALRTRDVPSIRPAPSKWRRPWVGVVAITAGAFVTSAVALSVVTMMGAFGGREGIGPAEPLVTTTPEISVSHAVVEPPRLPTSLPTVHMEFRGLDIEEGMKLLADLCHVSVVVPGGIAARADLVFHDVPCDQAIASVLESNGMDYDYHPAARWLRVDARRALEDDRRTIAEGRRRPDDVLPSGPTVDLDFKRVPIRDVLALVAKAGNVNFVVPAGIHTDVTVYASQLPWDEALRAILHANGLGYTYRPNGKIVRIDAQRMLDDEAANRPR